MSDDHIASVVDAFKHFEARPKRSAVATIAEIEANAFNLNITRYVDVVEEAKQHDLGQEFLALQAAIAKRNEAEGEMMSKLREIGLGT